MNFLNLPKLHKIFYSSILILYFLVLFRNYSGNIHSIYLFTWPYSLGLHSFTLDFFVQNTNQLDLSIIYSAFKFLKINMDNDFVGFIIYILFTSISGFYLFKIIRDFFEIQDNLIIFIILVTILYAGNLLVSANIGSWITNNPTSPTFFAHSLITTFIYFLLKRKTLIILFISSIMLLISVKSSWYTIGVGIVYSLFFDKKEKLYWIIGPLIVLGYFLSISEIQISEVTRRILFQNVIIRDMEEVAFHLQKAQRNLLLIFSFLVYGLILKKLKFLKIKNFSLVILILSICTFIFGYFYALKGVDIWPQPKLLALSFTRALGLYQLFFWVLVGAYINNLKINNLLKTGFYLFIFFIHIDSWHNNLEILRMKGLIIGSLLLTLFFLFNFITKKLNRNPKIETIKMATIFIVISSSVLFFSFNKKIQQTNFYAMKQINKWTVEKTVPNRKLDNLIILKKCKDFLLYDIDFPTWSPAIAGKSQFIGGRAYNHFSIPVMKKHKERLNIHVQILNKSKDKLGEQIAKKLYMNQTVIIIEDRDLYSIPDNVKYLDISHNYNLVFFTSDEFLEEFKNTCYRKFKI